MSSIGPEIPAHILAAGATRSESLSRSDAEGPERPRTGTVLSREKDDAPRPTPATVKPPPDDEDDDEDDYVPMLPPDLAVSRGGAGGSSTASKRLVGPAMPPGFGQPMHSAPGYGDEDDDEDDDFGPRPLPAGYGAEKKDAVTEFMEREERMRKAAEEAAKPKKLERDEWMLKPPSSSGLLATLDPTKLSRPRKFNTSTKTSGTRDTDNSLWTETPAERQQRLADEVSGKRRRVENASTNDEDAVNAAKKARRDAEIRRGVEEYTRTSRGDTLLAKHAKRENTTKEEEFKGIWDRDRDLGMGGRLMDDKTRSRIIKDSAGLKDRFGTGSSGGFL